MGGSGTELQALRDHLIAASLKLESGTVVARACLTLRDHLIAASLKHYVLQMENRRVVSSPRSSDRGLIEARMGRP